MQLVLEKGADVNAQGGEYGTALQAASANRDLDIVRLLLDKGADINARGGKYGTALQAVFAPADTPYSATPLHAAEVLLAHGADFTAHVPGSEFGDALSAAKECWKYEGTNLARFMKLLEARGWKGDEADAGQDLPPQAGVEV